MPRFTRFGLIALLAFVIASTPAAWAGPVPNGASFKLSTCVGCSLTSPTVAGAPTGKFLTVFSNRSLTAGSVVQGREFRPTGLPFGVPFRLPAPDTLAQYDPALASNATGAAVAAWSVVNPLTGNSDVRAQRYDANGAPVGAMLAVNSDDPAYIALDTLPAVAIGADGGFAVVWLREVAHGQAVPDLGIEVWARRYSPAGAPLTAPLKLSSGLVEGHRVSACIDGLKRTVVAWNTDDEIRLFEPSFIGVKVRRLNPTGAPLGAEIVVAAPKAAHSHTAVTCTSAGGFVVAWESDQAPAGGDTDIVAQRFATTAKPAGAKFVVNTSLLGDQRLPGIMTDAGGNFVIAWKDLGTGHAGVYGQRFSPLGVKLGTEFQVAPLAFTFANAPQLSPAGAANAFVVVWDDNPGVLGRRFKIAP